MTDESWNGGSVLWNVVKNVTIFGVLGPPFGALTWMLPTLVYLIATDGSVPLGLMVSNTVWMLVMGIVFSYFFGVLPAVLAGAMVGLGQVLFRSFGFFHATGVGLAVGLALFLRPDLLTIFGFAKGPAGIASGGDFTKNLGAVVLAIPLCVVPTLMCWAISRRIPLEK